MGVRIGQDNAVFSSFHPLRRGLSEIPKDAISRGEPSPASGSRSRCNIRQCLSQACSPWAIDLPGHMIPAMQASDGVATDKMDQLQQVADLFESVVAAL